MKDSLGDRIKFFENYNACDRLMPGLPVVIRLDGVSFHTFTKGLERPYDIALSTLMIDTTKYLVEETNACCGYTQSDEITLILYSDNYKSQIYFDGRIQKIQSVLSARNSLFFNKELPVCLPQKSHTSPVFDCRAFVVPSQIEAINALLWREKDATRNSISMAAQSVYSHKELHGKIVPQNKKCCFKRVLTGIITQHSLNVELMSKENGYLVHLRQKKSIRYPKNMLHDLILNFQ
jgi:tRNA(His) guanylyltransferase